MKNKHNSILLILALFLLSLMLSSCAHYDHNQVKSSVLTLPGGQKGDVAWSDKFPIYRTSWYYGATLLIEENYGILTSKSAYYNWFAPAEREIAEKCMSTIVSIEYNYDSRRVNPQAVRTELLNNGYTEFSAPEFEKQLINQPEMMMLSNNNYRIRLYCQNRENKNFIEVTHPGFEKVTLRLNPH